MFGKSQREKELENKIELLEQKLKGADVDERIKALEEERDARAKMFREREDDYLKEIVALKAARSTIEKEFNAEKALAFKTMELEFKQKLIEDTQKVKDEYDKKLRTGMEDNFKLLQEQLTKLHSEGNAQTKFVQEMALNITKGMMNNKPAVTDKSEPRAVTNESSSL